MKAILVVDMPKNCSECLLHYDDMHCIVFENMSIDPEKLEELREGYGYTSEYCNYRPPLCPLKLMPKKKRLDIDLFMSGNFPLVQAVFTGWNDCINEIEGGNNEEVNIKKEANSF